MSAYDDRLRYVPSEDHFVVLDRDGEPTKAGWVVAFDVHGQMWRAVPLNEPFTNPPFLKDVTSERLVTRIDEGETP